MITPQRKGYTASLPETGGEIVQLGFNRNYLQGSKLSFPKVYTSWHK